jgi:hypothetical protein
MPGSGPPRASVVRRKRLSNKDRLGPVEERQGRRRDLGTAAAGGPAARSLDRLAAGAAAAGAAAAPGLSGAAADPAAQPDPRHRGRRHQPVRLGAEAGILGRAHPHRPRQRPGRPLRAYLQGKARHGCAGCCARRRRPSSAPRSSRPLSSASRNGGGRRSPPPPSRAGWPPAPGTCSPTPGTPQPRHPPRPRQRRGDTPPEGSHGPG